MLGMLVHLNILNRVDRTPECSLNRPKLLAASTGTMPWYGYPMSKRRFGRFKSVG